VHVTDKAKDRRKLKRRKLKRRKDGKKKSEKESKSYRENDIN
jgi:hypothetical protein